MESLLVYRHWNGVGVNIDLNSIRFFAELGARSAALVNDSYGLINGGSIRARNQFFRESEEEVSEPPLVLHSEAA